jgi:hypothetical protein
MATFTVTNPDGNTFSPVVLTYTINDARYRYSEMTFRIRNTYRIQANALVKVEGSSSSSIIFLGYVRSVELSSPGTSLISCVSFSELLIERGLWPQTWAQGVDLNNILTSDPPSAANGYMQGLLFDINSLIQKDQFYLHPSYSNYTYVTYGLGKDSPCGILPEDALMFGPDPLYRSYDVDPHTLTIGHWTQTADALWVRFGTDADPFSYPVFVKNFKDTHIRLTPNADAGNSNEGPIATSWINNAYGTLRDIFRTNCKEWRFENHSDGYTYLVFGFRVGDGNPWYDEDPVLTLTEGDNILDHHVDYIDAPNVIYMEHSTGVICSSGWSDVPPGLIRERIIRDLTYTVTQVDFALSWELHHNIYSWNLITKSKEYDIQCGDWYNVIIGSTTYDLRVQAKTLKDGMMWLTGIDAGAGPEDE